MDVVHSADGTRITFDHLGRGDPLVLVSGASTGRALHRTLAELLAEHFTVLNYDRRGRGDSGDTAPYAVEREIEDLDAVLDVTGPARVFGNSSGAVLALRAAVAGLPIDELALWEPPIMLDPDAPRRHRRYITELATRLDDGRPGDAMALFLTSVGLPEQTIDGMRQTPGWSDLETVAPTLAYDAQVMGDSTLPAGLDSVTVPTVVLTGSDSGAWADAAAHALVAALPTSSHHVLAGQNHAVAWDVLAAALVRMGCVR